MAAPQGLWNIKDLGESFKPFFSLTPPVASTIV